MRVLAGLILLTGHALAHVMSMSTGDLAIQGRLAHFELRLPVYEMPHAANAAQQAHGDDQNDG